MKIKFSKTQKVGAGLISVRRRYRNVPILLAAMLCAGGSLLAGCGNKDASAPSPAAAPTPSAGMAAAPGAAGQETVKGTPEQEAAKQRAIDEGPAIQAANDPKQGGK